MKCQQYTEILNVYLDGELRDVPEAAVKHAEICADCRLLTQQLATLRSAARTLPPADLSESGQATIISGVQNRIAAMRSRKHILHIFGFSRFFAGLRWSRDFAGRTRTANGERYFCNRNGIDARRADRRLQSPVTRIIHQFLLCAQNGFLKSA